MLSLAYYISGHGFGHASRSIEVLNTLFALEPQLRVAVRTTTARWLFDRTLHGAVDFVPLETDTGVVQIDSLRIDEAETVIRAATFYATFKERAAADAQWLRAWGAHIVVGDIPPLAFAAAARAGLPSVAFGNFTWDWVYGGYPAFAREAPRVVPMLGEAYAHARLALRLPMSGGFEAMGAAVRDIPFVARRSTRARDEVRAILKLPPAGPAATVVLASFGGYGLAMDYARAAQDGALTIVTTDRGADLSAGAGGPGDHARPGRVVRLGEQELYDRGLAYEDLVAAADVVVTKPGYGIISEAVANHTAVLYTSRGRFIEYDVLVREMPRYTRSAFISQQDLLGGRWTPAVEALLAQPQPPEQPAVDGAAVAARAILTVARI